MSLDYYYALQVEKTNTPMIRFYGWDPFCLSLGKHQSDSEIDLVSLKSDGYELVRRPTGGSAIFHSDELTYSLLVPGRDLHHQEIYQFFHERLHTALLKYCSEIKLAKQAQPYRLNQGEGTFACFNRSAFSELQINSKKIVGSAQKILKNSLLQHGSIMLGPDHLRIINYIKTEKNIKDRLAQNLSEKSTDFYTETGEIPNKFALVNDILNEFKPIVDLKILNGEILQTDIEKSKQYDNMFLL